MNYWNDPNVPHKGWTCIEVIDLEDYSDDGEIKYEQCEMCNNERIRYVHIMTHPCFLGQLHVGCVCAEKMTDDYLNPRDKEKILRNKASRRSNFNSVEWNFNMNKNTYSKKYKGQYITIVKSKYGNYGVVFDGNSFWEYKGNQIYDFKTAEKLAFEVFEEYHTTKDERSFRLFMYENQNNFD